MGCFRICHLFLTPILFQKIHMGTLGLISRNHARQRQTANLTTAVLILLVLQKQKNNMMTTYDIGLWVFDLNHPPRPLSVIVKTLARDGYIESTGRAGKRRAFWRITNRGTLSLRNRKKIADAGRQFLINHPNLYAQEIVIMRYLLQSHSSTFNDIVSATALPLSKIRTGLKRLCLREFVETRTAQDAGYRLTAAGRIAGANFSC